VPDTFAGVYLSNELLDAFPVHRFRVGAGAPQEVYLDVADGRLVETLRDPGNPALGDEARRLCGDIEPGEGWEVEIRPGAEPWLRRVAERLTAGCVVTIDYGDVASRLFGPQRPQGTVRAIASHRLCDSLYEAPGETDLTASVDFSALQALGSALGLENAPLLSQRDFLFALGLAQEVERLQQRASTIDFLSAMESLSPLLTPGASGMGDTFRVLVQTKNLAARTLPLDPVQSVGGLRFG
jgi:SAM-dependent MidA family methyltransferase